MKTVALTWMVVFVTSTAGAQLLRPDAQTHLLSLGDSLREVWNVTYASGLAASQDAARAMKVDPRDGSIYVTGPSSGKFLTVKFSPDGVTQWTARYDGSEYLDCEAAALALDSSGNIYVAGTISTGFSFGGRGGLFFYHRMITTVKYNSAGVQQWAARYVGPRDSVSNSVVGIEVDRGGNTYVTCTVVVGTPTRPTITVVKYDPLGREEWLVQYDKPDYVYPNGMALDDSSNVYVTGYIGGSSMPSDFVTLKYNSSGSEQWVARYDGPAHQYDSPSCIVVDDSGNVFVGGSVTVTSSPNRLATGVVKYRRTGTQEWSALYSGSPTASSSASAIALDGSGNVVVTGWSNDGSKSSILTVKLNPAGSQLWASSVGSMNGPPAIALDHLGNAYVAGIKASSPVFTGMVAKIAANGAGQWSTAFSDSELSNGNATAIALDRAGNLYFAGYGNRYVSQGSSAFVLTKCDPAGLQQWMRRFNGGGASHESLADLVVDEQGNVYLTGTSEGKGTNSDFLTAKYTAGGSLQWAVRYDGAGNTIDSPSHLALDSFGNSYVVGASTTMQGNGTSVAIKYSPHGILEWASGYVPPDTPRIHSSAIAVDRSGNAYVSASFYSSGTSIPGCLATVKYDSFGKQQWVARYSSGALNAWYGSPSLVVDDSGNVCVSCIIDTVSVIIRYNTAGNQQWLARQSPAVQIYADTPIPLALGASGIICGATTIRPVGTQASTESLVFKYNAAGSLLWETRTKYPANTYTTTSHIALDRTGNLYVAGESSVQSRSATTVTKYNSAGLKVWEAPCTPGSAMNSPGHLAIDAGGNIYLTVISWQMGDHGSRIVNTSTTFEYDSSGVRQWSAPFSAPKNTTSSATSVSLDKSGAIVVGATSSWNSGSMISLTKYAQTLVSVGAGEPQQPTTFELHQNYPNPFNPKTAVSFQLPVVSDVRLVVYDILGRQVTTLVDERKPAGTYSVTFDATGLGSGVYFYRLTAGTYVNTCKMLVMK